MSFFIALLFYTSRFKGGNSSSGHVHVRKDADGYTLIRDGQPFFIQGAGGNTYFRELAEFGGNTIRIWDTVNVESILDSASLHNLAVVITLPMLPSRYLDFYRDREKVRNQYLTFSRFVKKHKNHPALLMWILGNELDFPYRPRYAPFYQAYNNLLDMIHKEDPDHPVTTSLVNFSRRAIINLRLKVPKLDLISINTFGGKLVKLRKEIRDFQWFWSGAFILTEWGVHAPWENETTLWGAPLENSSFKKAEQLKDLYDHHIPFDNPRLLGTLVFYWGAKQERTHSWFSLFDEEGSVSESALVLKNSWINNEKVLDCAKLNYILLNGHGGNANLIYTPGMERKAEAIFEKSGNDSLCFRWEILHEDWYHTHYGRQQKPYISNSVFGIINDTEFIFETPKKEGPYRLFLTVYDPCGLYHTANVPFYILNKADD